MCPGNFAATSAARAAERAPSARTREPLVARQPRKSCEMRPVPITPHEAMPPAGDGEGRRGVLGEPLGWRLAGSAGGPVDW
mmetsp:Transcript_26065/g.78557  ORF Transcript_26065/g.78557 Transcript_26065/m.78557 type:complete len:81 (+) Transcript_26065:962-1204(+)